MGVFIKKNLAYAYLVGLVMAAIVIASLTVGFIIALGALVYYTILHVIRISVLFYEFIICLL